MMGVCCIRLHIKTYKQYKTIELALHFENITRSKIWNTDKRNGTSTKRAGTTIIDVPVRFFWTSMFQRISVDVPASMFQRTFVDVLAHNFYIVGVPLQWMFQSKHCGCSSAIFGCCGCSSVMDVPAQQITCTVCWLYYSRKESLLGPRRY